MELFYRSSEVCPANHFLGHHLLENKKASIDIINRVNEIKQQYFQGDMERFDDETFKNLSNIFTDSVFLYGTDKTAR